MSTASPTAYLLWAILSILFQSFLLYHIWSYDKFQCVRWSSGRQPGAFKRVMTYSYLGSAPLFVLYSVATTVIKFREGYTATLDHHVFPTPLDMYSATSRHWIFPLNCIFSIAWGLELITHLEELAFWLYLLHQNPDKDPWFDSWEYRLWFIGSVVAVLGMPLTAVVARRNVDTLDAWIFLVGSAGSGGTTICFLYVLWCFPQFIRSVKSMGADPSVVVRLATFYQLNLARVVFRFLFTVPLFVLACDGILGSEHQINHNPFWADVLTMVAGIGCFVSTTITLLIFFPRSIIKETGYNPRPPTTVNSPKSPPITPPILMSGPFEPSQGPSRADMEEWYDDDGTSMYHAAPPYAGSPTIEVIHAGVQYGSHGAQPAYQRQPFPHSLSSPQILAPSFSQSMAMTPVPDSPLPQARVAKHTRRRSAIAVELRREESVQSSQQEHGLGLGTIESSSSSLGKKPGDLRSLEVGIPQLEHTRAGSMGHTVVTAGRQYSRQSVPVRHPSENLHPYLRTFTSPIDLVDLEAPPLDLPTRTV
ncbi:hypothetical protein BDY19DRAFT_937553 [Irpex rosettiformis]|uniref:Uncharacterized protein n=1 Tax=Irpex rosettiformis TaxID=378272 RepID=A0ACB8U973_9APHY|nr:hypothetical protein BDY19DRAFT_937553 [Irpex rosettiformis]